MSYLRYMCWLSHSGVQHILCCVFVLFVFVLCALCCRLLQIVHFLLPLRYSLMFISDVSSSLMTCFPFYSMSNLSTPRGDNNDI
jgi:hypothetical protein